MGDQQFVVVAVYQHQRHAISQTLLSVVLNPAEPEKCELMSTKRIEVLQAPQNVDLMQGYDVPKTFWACGGTDATFDA